MPCPIPGTSLSPVRRKGLHNSSRIPRPAFKRVPQSGFLGVHPISGIGVCPHARFRTNEPLNTFDTVAKITVLLADDHTLVRQGLKALLSAEEDMQVVAEAENGQQAVALARKTTPD